MSEAIAAVVVESQACENCTAATSLTLQFLEDVVAAAVVSAQLDLVGFATPGSPASASNTSFVENVVNTTVPLLAAVRLPQSVRE